MDWLDAAVESAKRVPTAPAEGRSYLRDVCYHAVRGAMTHWADAYEQGNVVDLGNGRRGMMSFGEDGYRVLVFVVDMPDPPSDEAEWRERARLSLDSAGSYGHQLAEVFDVG